MRAFPVLFPICLFLRSVLLLASHTDAGADSPPRPQIAFFEQREYNKPGELLPFAVTVMGENLSQCDSRATLRFVKKALRNRLGIERLIERSEYSAKAALRHIPQFPGGNVPGICPPAAVYTLHASGLHSGRRPSAQTQILKIPSAISASTAGRRLREPNLVFPSEKLRERHTATCAEVPWLAIPPSKVKFFFDVYDVEECVL